MKLFFLNNDILLTHFILQLNTDVPSKPVVLEKYKDDPLLQATNLNTENNELADKKDPKKMAKDII